MMTNMVNTLFPMTQPYWNMEPISMNQAEVKPVMRRYLREDVETAFGISLKHYWRGDLATAVALLQALQLPSENLEENAVILQEMRLEIIATGTGYISQWL